MWKNLVIILYYYFVYFILYIQEIYKALNGETFTAYSNVSYTLPKWVSPLTQKKSLRLVVINGLPLLGIL